MKLLKIVSSVVALGLGLSSVSYASSFFPPERISCTKNAAGSIRCEGFNHSYLVEGVSTSLFKNNEDTFYFDTGSAIFTPGMDEAAVSYTYKNSDHRIMKLRTTSVRLYPDFSNSSWTKVHEDLYMCDAGYMNCAFTDTLVDKTVK
jgi:hypothetical protein